MADYITSRTYTVHVEINQPVNLPAAVSLFAAAKISGATTFTYLTAEDAVALAGQLLDAAAQIVAARQAVA